MGGSAVRALCACEESQAVTSRLRRMGIEAYSCDLLPTSGNRPEWHIQADALELLKLRWDLIVAHPPCTYLTNAGAIRLFDADHSIRDHDRQKKGLEAKAFFERFMNAECPRVALENPVPMK